MLYMMYKEKLIWTGIYKKKIFWKARDNETIQESKKSSKNLDHSDHAPLLIFDPSLEKGIGFHEFLTILCLNVFPLDWALGWLGK